jgi:iron-sulfur cluster assembly protein
MAITLTESAANRVRTHIEKRGQGLGLRLGITTTGCSGYAYKIAYADEALADDVLFESHGVKVFVDADAIEYIDGTEVDFVKQGLNETFKFSNPKSAGECGCGESFTV